LLLEIEHRSSSCLAEPTVLGGANREIGVNEASL
jgi:hypothetical protein